MAIGFPFWIYEIPPVLMANNILTLVNKYMDEYLKNPEIWQQRQEQRSMQKLQLKQSSALKGLLPAVMDKMLFSMMQQKDCLLLWYFC